MPAVTSERTLSPKQHKRCTEQPHPNTSAPLSPHHTKTAPLPRPARQLWQCCLLPSPLLLPCPPPPPPTRLPMPKTLSRCDRAERGGGVVLQGALPAKPRSVLHCIGSHLLSDPLEFGWPCIGFQAGCLLCICWIYHYSMCSISHTGDSANLQPSGSPASTVTGAVCSGKSVSADYGSRISRCSGAPGGRARSRRARPLHLYLGRPSTRGGPAASDRTRAHATRKTCDDGCLYHQSSALQCLSKAGYGIRKRCQCVCCDRRRRCCLVVDWLPVIAVWQRLLLSRPLFQAVASNSCTKE